MADEQRLCGADELPPAGQVKQVECEGRTLCVANVGGAITAMPNECPHRGGPLGEGSVEAGQVMCPWHAWTFDPASGAVNGDDADRIPIYAVRIEGDSALVTLG